MRKERRRKDLGRKFFSPFLMCFPRSLFWNCLGIETWAVLCVCACVCVCVGFRGLHQKLSKRRELLLLLLLWPVKSSRKRRDECVDG